MTKVNLNANMHSNLLSLQKTKNLQDITQSRLSTGLKVNSAIDNPFSFYAAASLNNRAESLSALLDAMTQGTQTIKAANEGLETGLTFLQQAKSVANQALEKTSPPKTKPDYDGPIAARVSTEAELLDAIKNINPEKGAIVLINDINMSKNIGLTLKNDMKIVGLKGSEKLSFNFDSTTKAIGIEMAKNTEVSGLKINYTSANKTNNYDFHAIRNNGFSDIKLSNIDITINCDDSSAMDMSAIRNAGNGKITLSGDVNISIPSTSGKSIFGIFNNGKSAQLTQTSDSKLNITTAGEDCIGINAGINFLSGTVNLVTSGNNSPALGWGTNIISGNLNITTSGSTGHGISGANTTQSSGKISILTLGDGARGITGGSMDLSSSAELLIKVAKNNSTPISTSLSYATSAKIGIESAKNMSKAGFWQAINDKTSTTIENFETFEGAANWARIGNFPGITPIVLATTAKMFALATADNHQGAEQTVLSSSDSYNSILEQYNKLISDSGYKGINLLKKQDLKINFNEDRSTGLEVKGKDASSQGLGLTSAKWTDYKSIEDDINRLDSAIGKIRTVSSELGNYYSVINTREDFTQNLINTLTSGADKLTLADMNEESANMLALQTRQQLAVNSLSLASQTAQSILKLF